MNASSFGLILAFLWQGARCASGLRSYRSFWRNRWLNGLSSGLMGTFTSAWPASGPRGRGGRAGGGPRSHMPVGGKVVRHRRQNLCSSGAGEANVINSRRWRDQISLLLQTASLQTVVAAAEGHKCDWTHQWPRIHRGNVAIKDPAWDLNLYEYSIVSCIYVYIHWSGHRDHCLT